MVNPSVVEFRAEPNENLIIELEHLLERARSGEMVSGAFCGTCADGSVLTFISKSRNRMLELAAVTRLHHRLNNMADGDMRDG